MLLLHYNEYPCEYYYGVMSRQLRGLNLGKSLYEEYQSVRHTPRPEPYEKLICKLVLPGIDTGTVS